MTTASRTVLYVEDNVTNVRLMERIVDSQPGLELMIATDGATGLEMALARRPDLILLDLHLPDMPGADVLRQLRSDPRTRGIRIVVVSTKGASVPVVDDIGFRDVEAVLTKPLEISRILEILDDVAKSGDIGQDRAAVLVPASAPISDERSAYPEDARTTAVLRVVHDLHNELGTISNYGALLRDHVDGPSAASDIEAMMATAANAVGLTDQLCELAIGEGPASSSPV